MGGLSVLAGDLAMGASQPAIDSCPAGRNERTLQAQRLRIKEFPVSNFVSKRPIKDREPVQAAEIAEAVTAGTITYDDGATQTFDKGGATTYVEHGAPTQGEWYVDDSGRFCSYWPPSYRACYELRWLVEDGEVVGLEFTELNRGSTFTGRYS
ncbi:hypothetical protein ACX80W_00140 [Arthrobacter sp. TMN-37]